MRTWRAVGRGLAGAGLIVVPVPALPVSLVFVLAVSLSLALEIELPHLAWFDLGESPGQVTVFDDAPGTVVRIGAIPAAGTEREPDAADLVELDVHIRRKRHAA